MILEPGLLLKVIKSHLVITVNVNIVGVDADELLLVVSAASAHQGVALRLDTRELVHITSLSTPFDLPIYVEAF